MNRYIGDHLSTRLVTLAMRGLLLQLLEDAVSRSAVLECELGHDFAERARLGFTNRGRRSAQPDEELAEPETNPLVNTQECSERHLNFYRFITRRWTMVKTMMRSAQSVRNSVILKREKIAKIDQDLQIISPFSKVFKILKEI